MNGIVMMNGVRLDPDAVYCKDCLKRNRAMREGGYVNGELHIITQDGFGVQPLPTGAKVTCPKMHVTFHPLTKP